VHRLESGLIESALKKLLRSRFWCGTLRSTLALRPDVVNWSDVYQRTILHHAAALDHPAVASTLLTWSLANVHRMDIYNRTPLYAAAKANSFRTLACLLAHGARVDTRDVTGYTPLMCAADNNSRECCVALIAAGADVHREDIDETSALFYAATKHKYPRCIGPLLDAGALSSVSILRRTVEVGSPRGLHPLLRVRPASHPNRSISFNGETLSINCIRGLLYLDMWRHGPHDPKVRRGNLAYLKRVDAAGGITPYEGNQQRALVSLLRRHVAPRAPDDVLHVIVSFWGHPGSY
jgi:hypothetical protein